VTNLLRINGLNVEFRMPGRTVHAVKNLDLTIEVGQVVALVGESGSGKSATAQAIMRLLPQPPAVLRGAIRWGENGENVLDMSGNRIRQLRGGEIGMIFQEPMTALNPTWTCGSQVEEALELHGFVDPGIRRQRARDLFREVGIPEVDRRLDQYPHELSGGMRQRVCIAMALACSPKLLIADEPTTALDVTIQAQILDLLKKLQRERNMAVLFITHDLALVAEFADRVVLMRYGEKVEEGAVAEVFAHPKHPYTKALLACRPRLGSRGTRLPTVEDVLSQKAGS
jgi:ABC-type dipeptide/oligopeptide/nickel transport system ATPase component